MRGMIKVPDRNLEPPEPVIYGRGPFCGEEIYLGEEIVELDGFEYHEECFMDMAPRILLEQYGARRGVAEVATYG